MRCLVTGGAGFIGSNLAIYLEKEGHEVTVVDNFDTGRRENLKEFRGKLIDADISKQQLEGRFDVIFHEASITDPRYPDDENLIRNNMDGFKKIMEIARENNSKLIYASSASLYGNGPSPQREDQPKQLQSAYARSKLMMDDIAEKYFDSMHIIGLRYFNVYGPGEALKGRPASMIYHLSKKMKTGETPKLFKMGEQKRDHIYVKDCVLANIKALTAKSGVYNVGTGVATSFNEIVKIINNILGTDFVPEYIDSPYGENYQVHTQADTKKAEKELGFKASYTIRRGMEDYVPTV